MDESWKHVKWKKPVTMDHILFIFIYVYEHYMWVCVCVFICITLIAVWEEEKGSLGKMGITTSGYTFSLCDDRNVLKLDCGDSWTTLSVTILKVIALYNLSE